MKIIVKQYTGKSVVIESDIDLSSTISDLALLLFQKRAVADVTLEDWAKAVSLYLRFKKAGFKQDP